MLNIIVLVKQVPNTSEVKIDPETNNLIREGIPSIVNPYDLYAIEEASFSVDLIPLCPDTYKNFSAVNYRIGSYSQNIGINR
jgi:hypothetical protein